MGGFRFKETEEGDFINVNENLKIPPLADVRDLIAASMEIEKSEEENLLPAKSGLPNLCNRVLPWAGRGRKPVSSGMAGCFM